MVKKYTNFSKYNCWNHSKNEDRNAGVSKAYFAFFTGFGYPVKGFINLVERRRYPVPGLEYPVAGFGYPVTGFKHPAQDSGNLSQGWGTLRKGAKNRYHIEVIISRITGIFYRQKNLLPGYRNPVERDISVKKISLRRDWLTCGGERVAAEEGLTCVFSLIPLLRWNRVCQCLRTSPCGSPSGVRGVNTSLIPHQQGVVFNCKIEIIGQLEGF